MGVLYVCVHTCIQGVPVSSIQTKRPYRIYRDKRRISSLYMNYVSLKLKELYLAIWCWNFVTTFTIFSTFISKVAYKEILRGFFMAQYFVLEWKLKESWTKFNVIFVYDFLTDQPRFKPSSGIASHLQKSKNPTKHPLEEGSEQVFNMASIC